MRKNPLLALALSFICLNNTVLSTPAMALENPVPIQFNHTVSKETTAWIYRVMADELNASKSLPGNALVLGYAEVDLNHDRISERLIRVDSPYFGRKSALTAIYVYQQGQWVRVLDRIGNTLYVISNGKQAMPDVIFTGSELENPHYVWDGNKYTLLPSKPEAQESESESISNR